MTERVVIRHNGVRTVIGVRAGAGVGVTDHGALSGLGDDDHPQYARIDGTRGTIPEFTDTAFETISALNVVTLTANGVELFEPAGTQGVAGVARTAASASNPVTIQTSGPINSPGAGLTPGQWYWAGPGGTLVSTPPATGLVVPIGFAATADEFVVQVGDVIELAP